jgi:hypothetical protein
MAWVQLHCLATQCRASTIMFEGGEWSPAGDLFLSINTSYVAKGLEAVVTSRRINVLSLVWASSRALRAGADLRLTVSSLCSC